MRPDPNFRQATTIGTAHAGSRAALATVIASSPPRCIASKGRSVLPECYLHHRSHPLDVGKRQRLAALSIGCEIPNRLHNSAMLPSLAATAITNSTYPIVRIYLCKVFAAIGGRSSMCHRALRSEMLTNLPVRSVFHLRLAIYLLI